MDSQSFRITRQYHLFRIVSLSRTLPCYPPKLTVLVITNFMVDSVHILYYPSLNTKRAETWCVGGWGALVPNALAPNKGTRLGPMVGL